MTRLLKKYKKAVGGAVTTAVTYVVVDKLGLGQEIAAAVSGILTGLVVSVLKNVTNNLDEAIATGAAYVRGA